ncbi:hypothetical protein VE00_09011 [Pseudogymnoascus sp. WSF 3629]|nr:hypothetical protein VE00_09011 [Pseudogymnoascus sp. WSF 3629]
MEALRRMQFATKHDLKLRISNLWNLQIEDRKELKTVERSIEFTKELQQLRNRVDLRTLPPEIRRNILKFLLVKDVCIPARNIWSGGRNYNLAVFCTCKLLQVEAYEIFYGYNTFAIDWTRSLHNLNNFAKFLRHVKVKIDSHTRILDLLKAIESSKQLQSLSIEIQGN